MKTLQIKKISLFSQQIKKKKTTRNGSNLEPERTILISITIVYGVHQRETSFGSCEGKKQLNHQKDMRLVINR